MQNATFVGSMLEQALRKAISTRWSNPMEAFQALAEERTGVLTLGQLQKAIKELVGMEATKWAVQQLMTRIDSNCDGDIDVDEWLAFMPATDLVKSIKSVQENSTVGEAPVVLALRKAVAKRWPLASAAFKDNDADGNGILDFSELQTAVESLLGPQSLEAMQHIMSLMDTNGDGQIGMDEWLDFMHKPSAPGDPVRFEDLEHSFREAVAIHWPDSLAAFKEIDIDGNGTLQVEELQNAVECLLGKGPPAAVQQLMTKIDTNGDGDVAVDEWCTFMDTGVGRAPVRTDGQPTPVPSAVAPAPPKPASVAAAPAPPVAAPSKTKHHKQSPHKSPRKPRAAQPQSLDWLPGAPSPRAKERRPDLASPRTPPGPPLTLNDATSMPPLATSPRMSYVTAGSSPRRVKDVPEDFDEDKAIVALSVLKERIELKFMDLRAAFLAVDEKKKGKIDRWKLAQFLKKKFDLQWNRREMEWLAEQYDPDGDGMVSLQDFMTVMQTA